MTETVGAVLDRIEAQQVNTLQLKPDAMSLDLLRAVYRSPDIPLAVRIRAAVAALPHEVPRLAVTALVSDQSFAELLERRLKHLSEIENGNGKIIDRAAVETTRPIPRLADRRYRRL